MNKKAFTLLELVIGVSLLALIISMFFRWFFLQNRYQKQLMEISRAQQIIRKANTIIAADLRTARSIIWPSQTGVQLINIKSDTKVVFKNFEGDIVSYYYIPSTKEIKKCIIPNDDTSQANIEPEPIAVDIEEVAFTRHSIDPGLISLYFASKGAFGIDSIFLLNE